VPLPDKKSRRSILSKYLEGKQFSNINLDYLAEMTGGFSGAQLKNLINEALILSVREGKTLLSQENVEDAIEKLLVGIAKKEKRDDVVLKRVAVHEIGHALIAALFSDSFVLKKVTIQNTYSGAGGYTIFNELPVITEGGLYTKDVLQKRLMIALGGKAAEYIFYGDPFVSLGAVQDLKQANGLAQKMVGNYGMGNDLEVFYNEVFDESLPSSGSLYSEKRKESFDQESLELVTEAYEKAKYLLEENKDLFLKLVHELLKKETLKGEWVQDFIQKNK
jgi:cell division protease FtsH